MKIVWLCTFSDAEKASHLSLWRNARGEYGKWIPNLLKAFKGDVNYELHVVSFQYWMRNLYCTWKSEGITYHCFQPHFPPFGFNARIPFEEMTRFQWNRWRVRRLLSRIQPDLVHLFGLENPRYATSVLDLPKGFPCVCTVQGFASRELNYNDCLVNRVRARYEKLIAQRVKYFFTDCEGGQLIKSWNPDAVIDNMYFPVDEDLVAATPPQSLEYDALFAGGQTKAKGFGDFLNICAYCAERKPDFRAAVVGTADAYQGTVEFMTRHHLEHVITFTGRFPTQEGLFVAYRKSKTFLAPTYNDAFASTIRENMLLGTPCIAYKTGGIPFANNDGNENVVIVNQGDWRTMAERVLYYAQHENERRLLADRAKSFAERTFSLEVNAQLIKIMYNKILKEHKNVV